MSDRDGVQKLGPQHYRVWWVELGSGKRRSRVVRDTLEQAKKVRAAIVDSQTRREYVSPSTLTLERYLRGWLEDHELRGETARSTHERYRSLLLGSVLERLGRSRCRN